MYRNKKIGAVVVAAGSGTRMGEKIPKQFLNMKGRPMVFHSVWAFISCHEIDKVVLVTGEDYISYCEGIFPKTEKLTIVPGGKERSDSVRAGLAALGKEADYVLVHDGARPYIKKSTIAGVLEKTLETGAAIPAVVPKDTIRTQYEVLERDSLFSVQTPQGFRKDILEQAYEEGEANGFFGTDDASYVEQLGIRVSITQGDYGNIKITTKEDLPEQESLETRVGSGYDVHRLVEGRDLILGGVNIPYNKGLLGHSDADVLLHALMDALLGAASLGDIGEHFPDTEEAYKGISSLELLDRVAERLKEEGFSVGNIDATIMAQKPKLAPYKEKMKNNIAEALGIPLGSINLKATTTEKLGFVGREEGIAAEAVCIIKR